MKTIIGRDKEIQELNDLFLSNKAQLVAVYGRRRVGKTFLVDEALRGRITPVAGYTQIQIYHRL